MIKEDTRIWLPSVEAGLDHYPLTAADRTLVAALVEAVGATRAYRLNNKTDEYVGYALSDRHDTVVLMQRRTYVTVPARAGVDESAVGEVVGDLDRLRPTTHNIEAGGTDVRLSGWRGDWPGDTATRGSTGSRGARRGRAGRKPWDPCLTCGTSTSNGWQCLYCERGIPLSERG